MKIKLIKPFLFFLGLLFITIILNSCSITNLVYIRDYDERMRLVRENFPEIYNLYINGNVVIDEVYTYDNKKTGTPRVHVSYRYR